MDKLGIQWKILLAQTISFSIVFFVLWRFAYKPIFPMLQARREKIAEALANAEKIKGDVARTEAERQKILADAGDQANKLIDDARQAAARVREQETQKAIAAAEQIVVQGARSRRAGTRPDAGAVETRSRPARGADHRDGHRQGVDRRRSAASRRRNPKAIGLNQTEPRTPGGDPDSMNSQEPHRGSPEEK
jgi:F0F1-type ATP synthase membrane subunit b/b'